MHLSQKELSFHLLFVSCVSRCFCREGSLVLKDSFFNGQMWLRRISCVRIQHIGSKVIGNRNRANIIPKIITIAAIFDNSVVPSAQPFAIRTHFYRENKNWFKIINNQHLA